MAIWQIKPKLDNPETVKKLEHAFALDCSIPEACFYAWISKQSYYDLLIYKPELVDRFAWLRQKPVLTARTTVVNACKDNPELALKYLERKRKDEFSVKSVVDNTMTISIKDIENATDEELSKILQ